MLYLIVTLPFYCHTTRSYLDKPHSLYLSRSPALFFVLTSMAGTKNVVVTRAKHATQQKTLVDQAQSLQNVQSMIYGSVCESLECIADIITDCLLAEPRLLPAVWSLRCGIA